jgi:2-oxoglutarate ferredoxin oxidoreductase subunit gamma
MKTWKDADWYFQVPAGRALLPLPSYWLKRPYFTKIGLRCSHRLMDRQPEGSTRSDVIISDSAINYPKVVQPNVLVCLTQEAYNNFYPIIRPGGLLITDSRYVKIQRKVDAQQKELPMHQAVMEKIGKPIVFNICMLGAVISLTGLVTSESIMKVLKNRIPGSFLEINRNALDLGMTLAEDVKS